MCAVRLFEQELVRLAGQPLMLCCSVRDCCKCCLLPGIKANLHTCACEHCITGHLFVSVIMQGWVMHVSI